VTLKYPMVFPIPGMWVSTPIWNVSFYSDLECEFLLRSIV
jgi:hypothetical protein